MTDTGTPAGRNVSAVGERFAIATPHALATRAGHDTFMRGGNAIDAAIAANAMLGVVYPHMCGIGGDLFAAVRLDTGKTLVVNGSGAAPGAVDLEAAGLVGRDLPPGHPLSITVPGAVAAWNDLLQLGGSLSMAEVLEPAIAAAETGTPVASSVALAIAGEQDRLQRDSGIRGVFLRDGRPLREGTMLGRPALARTLRALAQKGAGALYGGEVGSKYAAGLQALGSPLTLDDLANHRTEITAPLGRRYRGREVLTAPPNSQGFLLLEILEAVEASGLVPDHLGPDVPLLAEIFRLASADRDRYLADPRHNEVPVDMLLGAEHVSDLVRRARGRAGRAAPEAQRGTGDTVGIVAADRDGNAISLIQSISATFGAGILEPATGIIPHNRGAAFSTDLASPNAMTGGRRPAHTLMPVLVEREGRVEVVAGTMGGLAHAQIHTELLMGILDGGRNPADVLRFPRWLVGGLDMPSTSSVVVAECRVPQGILDLLTALPMEIVALGPWDERVGHAHLIRIRDDGWFEVAADPRSDGAAIAY